MTEEFDLNAGGRGCGPLLWAGLEQMCADATSVQAFMGAVGLGQECLPISSLGQS